ncbi:MAG TPA: immunoglobulin domain-containing protein [Terracidiphilus sp.]
MFVLGDSEIGEYTTLGTTVNASLITGLTNASSIAISGNYLFVTSYGPSNGMGSIGEYTTTGATVNATLVSGLNAPDGIAVSGNNLFVSNLGPAGIDGNQPGPGTIGEYATTGVVENAMLVSGLVEPVGIAVSGSNLFVLSEGPEDLIGYNQGSIGEYTTTGAAVNATLVSGLNEPASIAVLGTDLFVTYGSSITQITTSGATVGYTAFEGGGAITVADPSFTVQPMPVTMAAGQTASFYAAAIGNSAVTYQWELNGVPIAGATDQYLEVANVSPSNVGSYTCIATDAAGSTASSMALLALSTSTDLSRIINLSVRAKCGTGSSDLVAGFILGGSGNDGSAKPLLVRAVGPELSEFEVPGVLPDPSLLVYNTTINPAVAVAHNTGWSSTPANEDRVIAADSQTGAFPLSVGSLSSALVAELAPAAYTANIAGVSGDTGIALAEVYDTTTGFTPTSPRLINVSARANVTPDAGALIAGFVVGGSTDKTVLIRGTGPGLGAAPFNIPNVLSAPTLTVYSTTGGNDTLLAYNAGWGGDAVLAQVASQVYAFPQNATSADCAVLLTLPPGLYTANLNSGDGTTGIALVEVYEVP